MLEVYVKGCNIQNGNISIAYCVFVNCEKCYINVMYYYYYYYFYMFISIGLASVSVCPFCQ